MPKAVITWRSKTDDGEPCEVQAEKLGDRWMFQMRPGRYEDWKPYRTPTEADYLILLDGLRRRIARRWFRPEEETRLIRIIHEHYPSAKVHAQEA